MGNDWGSAGCDVAAPWIVNIDPRGKLVALTAVLVAVFSATQIWRLALLTMVVLLAVMVGRVSFLRVLKRVYALRWVLVAGVLLHLIGGSGRTLMGLPFLSLDGLIAGSMVGWRLILAVTCSSLFCWTTSAPALLAAVLVVMRPVEGLVPIHRVARHGMLVLMWLPRVQDEVLAFMDARKAAVGAHCYGVAGWVSEFGHLFDRLILATDTMADAVLGGEVPVSVEGAGVAHRLAFRDLGIFFVVGIFAFVWFWGLP